MADTSNLINLPRLTTYDGLIKDYIDDKTAVAQSTLNEITSLTNSVTTGKGVIAEAIKDKGGTASSSNSFAELGAAIEGIKTGSGNATADQVLQGATFTNSTGEELTGTIPKVTVSSPVTPGTSDSKIISGKSYVNNDVTVKGDSGLVAANIRSGASIFGVSGGFSGDATATAAQILSGKTAAIKGAMVTGTMTDRGAVAPAALAAGGSYTIPAGFHNGSGKVTAATLASQTSATATAADMLSGKTAYVNGALVTGSIASKAAATYTPGTANQTIAAGQYLSGAQTIAGSSNLVAGNIKSGVKIFNVTGSYVKTLSSMTQTLSGVLKQHTTNAGANTGTTTFKYNYDWQYITVTSKITTKSYILSWNTGSSKSISGTIYVGNSKTYYADSSTEGAAVTFTVTVNSSGYLVVTRTQKLVGEIPSVSEGIEVYSETGSTSYTAYYYT